LTTENASTWRECAPETSRVTECHSPDQIHGFAFMPALIPDANHVIMEIAGLVRIQIDPA
jgi:hypothetical protein